MRTAAESRLAPAPGTRFALCEPVERGPHFVAPAGATGMVVYVDEYVICMHMDDYLPGRRVLGQRDNDKVSFAVDLLNRK